MRTSVEYTLRNVFNQIVNFNDHQKLVFAKRIPAKLPIQTSPKVNLWLNQLLVKNTLDGLTCLVNK